MSIEFDKLIDYYKSYSHSNLGKEFLETFSPSTDYSFIINRLNLINEIQKIIILKGVYDFRGLFDLKEILLNSHVICFSYEDFKIIISSLSISNIISKEKNSLIDFVHYTQFIAPIKVFSDHEATFHKIFNNEGEVLDTASSNLKTIRQNIRRLKEKIQSVLNFHITDKSMETYLQDKVITKRDERFVIPVKDSYSYMVEGISHGHSSSGATIYVEPKEVVPLNNELNILYSREKEEIYKIFCDFTLALKQDKESILVNQNILSCLDGFFACGMVSNTLQAIIPEISEENEIILQRCRHPLLILKLQSLRDVIPFDLTIGKDFKVLLISGPNTGGKTIMLKAVGLCTTMALSGLPIPVDFGSKIGIMYNIVSDIGDNQSIESSLSTFSGHIKNIKKIIDLQEERSLVMIDEIGSATDPEQGAVLAQAILEKLVSMKVLAVITTHYTTLKIFAENTASCVNASMQFDQQKHEPTYRFSLGFPGNSFAIEMATKLGLDESLINRANELSGSQSVDLTELIKKISSEKNKLVENNYELELTLSNYSSKISELDKKIESFEKEKKLIIKNTISEIQQEFTEIQKQLSVEIESLKRLTKTDKKNKINSISSNLTDVNNTILRKKKTLLQEDNQNNIVLVGDSVWLTSFETEAVVVDIQKEIYRLEMNGIFFDCKIDELELLNKSPKTEKVVLVSKKNTTYEGKSNMEINLLGKTFDESKPLIEDLIDNALLLGLTKIRIIHGRGTGILRQKIREYLKTNKKVIEFFSPPQESGGDGVTVVSL